MRQGHRAHRASAGRPGRRDRERLRAIEAELARLPLDGTPALATLMPPIGELLDIERPIAYGLDCTDSGLRCAFAHGAVLRGVAADIDASLSASNPLRWARYNPFCPEPHQRNRVRSLTPADCVGLGNVAMLRRQRLDRLHQIRVLVCDGPVLLAWVGGADGDPITAHQEQLLARLVPALGRRLALERRMQRADLVPAALDHLLDRLGQAAYLVGPRGALWHCNAAGARRLERGGAALLARLRRATRGGDPEIGARPLVASGMRGTLLVERAAASERPVAQLAAARWALTPRQAEVLALVLAGHTNARIAVELGIAPGTVELHVSAILARAEADSRAALVAAAWAIAGAVQ